MRTWLESVTRDLATAPQRSTLFAMLIRRPENRAFSITTICLMVMVVGVVDYVTGTWMSLVVFYLLPVAIAAAWLGLVAAFFVSLAAVFVRIYGDYLLDAPYAHHPTVFWNALVWLANFMILAWVLRALLLQHRKLEVRVRQRTQALAEEVSLREDLQRQLLAMSESERRMIGNDLHDGLGQHLTATAMAAKVLARKLVDKGDPESKAAVEIVRLAEGGIDQSRKLARGLLLTAIEPEKLDRELEELASTTSRDAGVECRFINRDGSRVKDSLVASQLYRIAQEAVRNAVRHASPSKVGIELGNRDGKLVLEVADDGSGLQISPERKSGVGLQVMSERARLIGGAFSVETVKDHGVRVRCTVPLESTKIGSLG